MEKLLDKAQRRSFGFTPPRTARDTLQQGHDCSKANFHKTPFLLKLSENTTNAPELQKSEHESKATHTGAKRPPARMVPLAAPSLVPVTGVKSSSKHKLEKLTVLILPATSSQQLVCVTLNFSHGV